MAAVLLSRIRGAKGVVQLKEALEDAGDASERTMILTALVNAGDTGSAAHLHQSLCDLDYDLSDAFWFDDLRSAITKMHETLPEAADAWAGLYGFKFS